jgi:hypothetical protein
MSIPGLHWAFKLPIKGASKAVMLVLADHANELGECWPSVGRLACRAGVSDRSVRSALRALEADRLIRTRHVTGHRSTYTVLIGAKPIDSMPVSASASVSAAGVAPSVNFRPPSEAAAAPPRKPLPPNPQYNPHNNLHGTFRHAKRPSKVGKVTNGDVPFSNEILLQMAKQLETTLGTSLSEGDHETLRWLLVDRRIHVKSLLNEVASRIDRQGVDRVRADMHRQNGLRTFVDGVLERITRRRLMLLSHLSPEFQP